VRAAARRLPPLLAAAALALAAGARSPLRPAALAAQTVASERIVAVVGDDAILLSEVEEQTVLAAGQAGIDEKDAAAMDKLRREVLEQMIADLMVVEAAQADDSIDVSSNNVNEAVEAELNEIRSRFPSTAEFEREIGRSQWRTLDNYKKNLRRIKERELLAQAFLQKNASRIPSPVVSDDEVRRYYEENRERFGDKPPTVTIRQLNLLVRPTAPARERAQALADSLMAEVRNGASFTDLAKQYSGDKASAQKGGDLGYFKRGVMVKPFEEAVFAIDSIGGLTGPVETEFGFHIIRLEDRQREEIRARHILITPEVSEADRAVARSLGEALVDSLGAGADFDSLAARHATGGRLEPIEGPLTQLPAEWQEALGNLPVGATTGLLTTPAGFAILKLEGKTEGKPYTFEELEPRIRSQLSQTLGQKEFIEALRKSVYVEVRLPEAGAAAVTAATPAPTPGPSLGQPGGGAPLDLREPQAAEPPPIGAPATDSLPTLERPAAGDSLGIPLTPPAAPSPAKAEPAPATEASPAAEPAPANP
jgi:peptidyl-prolyl cis-trans isomerase SurA